MGEHEGTGGAGGHAAHEPHPLIGGRGAALRDLAAAFDQDGLSEYAQVLRARPEFSEQGGRLASTPSPTVPHPRPMETQP
ncbi:hypothetical protein ACTWJ8_28000 [Streptomyces sp. SDT5-1]|uniref:hypothetical protein n=1 Tax=Streptomyces sp. SDT5-1 TaxID=3406418 RepID=UPI003FD1DBD4